MIENFKFDFIFNLDFILVSTLATYFLLRLIPVLLSKRSFRGKPICPLSRNFKIFFTLLISLSLSPLFFDLTTLWGWILALGNYFIQTSFYDILIKKIIKKIETFYSTETTV